MAQSEQVNLILKLVDKSSKEIKAIDKRLNELDKTTRKTDKTTKRMESSVAGLGRAAAGSVAAFVSLYGAINLVNKAITTFATFDEKLARLNAISGATTKEFKKLEKQAKALGAATVFSASQVVDAQNFMAMAGFEANEILESTAGVLDLARIAAVDLGTAADIASNILSGFGKNASEISRVTDVMTATMTNANTNMLQLGDAMKFVAPVSKAAGTSIEETATAIGILSDAGIQGTLAGTALRTILLRLTAPAKEAQQVMKDIGFSAFDANGEFIGLQSSLRKLNEVTEGFSQQAKQAIFKRLFDTEAISAAITLLGQVDKKYDTLFNTIKDSAGKTIEVSKILSDNLAASFKEVDSAIEAVQISITQKYEPAINSLAKSTAGFFRTLAAQPESAVGVFSPTLIGKAFAAWNLFFDETEKGVKKVEKPLKQIKKTIEESIPPIAIAVKHTGDWNKSLAKTWDAAYKVSKALRDSEKSAKAFADALAEEQRMQAFADGIGSVVEGAITTAVLQGLEGDIDPQSILKGVGRSLIALGLAFELQIATSVAKGVAEGTAAGVSGLGAIAIGAGLIGAAGAFGGGDKGTNFDKLIQALNDNEDAVRKNTERKVLEIIDPEAAAVQAKAERLTEQQRLTALVESLKIRKQEAAAIENSIARLPALNNALKDLGEAQSALAEVEGEIAVNAALDQVAAQEELAQAIGNTTDAITNAIFSLGDISRQQQGFIDQNLGLIETGTESVGRLQERFAEEAEQAEALRATIGTDATAEQIAQLAKEEQDVLDLGQALIDKTRETFASTEQAESIIADVIRTVDENQNNLLSVQETLLTQNNDILVDIRTAILAQNDILAAEVTII